MGASLPSLRDERAAWLRLALVPGLGPIRQRTLLKAFGSPEAAVGAGRSALEAHVPPALARALRDGPDAALLDRTLNWLDLPQNHLVTLADEDYPRPLLEIGDPPVVFYLKGRRELLGQPAIAVIGSRAATARGEADAESFARALADAGFVIVSGLAMGIDAAGHRGGLAGRASSIAVVGTGLDTVYPARNRDLAHALADRGALVSEYPLGTPVLRSNFPRRNRIISGLARGVLVVEAAAGSGSLITARLAGEQGREVLAIPGSIHSPHAKGCHALIKQGAKLVESAADVLEELGVPGTNAGGESPTVARQPSGVPLPDRLGHGPFDVDAFAAVCGATIADAMAALTELELQGLVERLPGGRFQRIA